jgi:nucleoside-diphosphate-sugar epimerase
MSLPRVLITGADGLIGKYAVRLLSSFFTVLAVSRREKATFENGVSHARTDLSNPDAVNRLLAFHADVIVHLAAAIPQSLDDEQVALANQLIDTNLFNLANASGASVIFCSSVSVYENLPGPWIESMTLSPSSTYGRSKLMSEQLFSGLDAGALSIRIGSPYGVCDPMRKGVLFHFAREALAGRSLRLYGHGARTQDFVHALDISNAILKIVQSWEAGKGLAQSGPLNVASGVPVSMRELAHLVLQEAGNFHPLSFVDEQNDEDSYRSYISIAQSSHLIGWKPEVSLADGVNHLLRSLEGKNEDWFVVRRSR